MAVLLLLTTVGGLSIYFASGASGGSSSQSTRGSGLFEKLEWASWAQQAIPSQVNEDAIADPVGWVKLQRGSKQTIHLAAFDGESGDRLWITDPLIPADKLHAARLVRAGKRLLFADHMGRLRALAVATGEVSWQVLLGQQVERIYGAGEGMVRVELKDEQSLVLELTQGKEVQKSVSNQTEGSADQGALAGRQRASAHPSRLSARTAACEEVWSGSIGGETALTRVLKKVRPRLQGLNVRYSLLDCEGNQLFALAAASKGARFPVVARFTISDRLLGDSSYYAGDAKELWRQPVSEANPLTLKQYPPEIATFAAGRLVVPYALDDRAADTRLACFDGESGRRLWDVAIPGSRGGNTKALVATDRRLFVSVYCCSLHVFELETGKHLMTIGRR